jgi:hypothetical protein
MKLALIAALAIVSVAAIPSAARALPHLGRTVPSSAAPSFLVQIRHHHHHHHHWRYWSRYSSRPGETADETAPAGAGSSAAPEGAATALSGGKPKIQWVDPDTAGR